MDLYICNHINLRYKLVTDERINALCSVNCFQKTFLISVSGGVNFRICAGYHVNDSLKSCLF
jgi:hypothetical protein